MRKIQLTNEQREYLKSLLELIGLVDGDEKFSVENEINLIKEVFKNGYIDTELELNTWGYAGVQDMINSWKYWYLDRLPLLQL